MEQLEPSLRAGNHTSALTAGPVSLSLNPFAGFRWYPIMDVAVKTTGDYADGSGDMIVKDIKIYSN